jgi:hypothetical protein
MNSLDLIQSDKCGSTRIGKQKSKLTLRPGSYFRPTPLEGVCGNSWVQTVFVIDGTQTVLVHHLKLILGQRTRQLRGTVALNLTAWLPFSSTG